MLNNELTVFKQPNGSYSFMMGDLFYSNNCNKTEIEENVHEAFSLCKLPLDQHKVSSYVKDLVQNSTLITIEDLQEKIDRYNLYLSKKIGSINCELHLLEEEASFMEKLTGSDIGTDVKERIDILKKRREDQVTNFLDIDIFCKKHIGGIINGSPDHQAT